MEGHRPRQRRALLLALWITSVFFALELAGGLWTQSLMLLSDAVHMLSHLVALAISYVAIRLAARPHGQRAHFGLYRAEILGAFVNGLGVLVLGAWIVFEAAVRLFEPAEIRGPEMIAIAAVGLAANLWTAWILHGAGTDDLNTKSAYLHLLGDLFSSVAILVGGVLVTLTGALWIDPLASAVVALIVLRWGVGLVRDSALILMEVTPRGLDMASIDGALRGLPGVRDVHDVHVWEITSGYQCLTAHLQVDDAPLSGVQALHESARELLEERFGIGHVTLQIESRPGESRARVS